MKISSKGRYALRMMVDIAENQENSYVRLKDVAERQGISKKYLEQIALLLSQAGMLRAMRGFQGGYRLARSAADYTVAEILLAAEGSIAPVACLDNAPNLCRRSGACKTLPVWEGLQRRIDGYLTAITLEDVANGTLPDD